MATAKAAKKLFLVDAMGFVFRAFFAPMDRLRNAAGLPTKVPYLFSNMLRRIIKDYQPNYIGVAFDVTGPTFRDKLFAEYKAQRPPMPDDLAIQLPYVRKICEAMCLAVLEAPGYEADDIIGALSRQAEKSKLDVMIVTSDKDMMQLVGGRVRVLRPGTGGAKADVVVDDAKVEELMGVPPSKVADVMALMGDSIDNIPGAKGIGEKGAREIIRRFGSAEAALDAAAQVENKRYREALQNCREQVLLSKQLAKIDCDAPITLELSDLERREPDANLLRELYTELGFTSLLKELPQSVTSASATQDTERLGSAEAIGRFLSSVPASSEIAVWLEPAPGEREAEGFGTRIAAVELSPAPGVSRAVWWDEAGESRRALEPFLADATRPKIVHDPKLIELLAGPVNGIRHATMLYSYLLRPTTGRHDLASVILRHRNLTLPGAPGERADQLQYLAPMLAAEVESAGLTELYRTIDLPLAPVLADMERCGIHVDPRALEAMSEEMNREIRALERKIWDHAEIEFNVNSPAQLAEILFDKMNLQPSARRGRAKNRSTAADILEELALLHEMPRNVLAFRELSKLKSTYADTLPKLVDPATGRVHTSFNQTGTATGRLSSSDPNLQNIPVRTELGRQIRAAFTAEPGWTLLSADYSQVELRILAHCSEDPVLREAFRTGQDIHSRTAQEVFGVGPMAQTAEHRRAAKIINFGIVYGLSAFGLAPQLGVAQREAAQFIAAYFARYSGVKNYLDELLAETRRTGVSRTIFGRIRPIPEISSPQPMMRNAAERTALNTPLQGTAADLIKVAMIRIHRELREGGFRARMVLQVHDELLFESPDEELESLGPLVKAAMEEAYRLSVPLVVDVKAGPNWRDMS